MIVSEVEAPSSLGVSRDALMHTMTSAYVWHDSRHEHPMNLRELSRTTFNSKYVGFKKITHLWHAARDARMHVSSYACVTLVCMCHARIHVCLRVRVYIHAPNALTRTSPKVCVYVYVWTYTNTTHVTNMITVEVEAPHP